MGRSARAEWAKCIGLATCGLQRDVALKLLPEEFASDDDRLARFQREAQLLASLNHPHIAAIYGLEERTPSALVMELVDGPTLEERIIQGPLPTDEALAIARQMAEAWEYAHEQGVMHRDLFQHGFSGLTSVLKNASVFHDKPHATRGGYISRGIALDGDQIRQ